MSDEKRQTRLLPFRLRRATQARRGALDGAEDFSADAELSALLRAWEAPPPDPRARQRLLADFRASARRAPLWRRALSKELRVPLPVAACAALALFVSLFALGARARTGALPPASKTEAPPTVLKVVEVPVVQERVVTRTVYVEKKQRGAARAASSQEPPGEALASEPEAKERAEPRAAEQAKQTGYFTRVDMEDFQPADEMKIKIVRRGKADEK